MEGIAKGVLISIIVAICIMLFTNLIFFFPWYMTVVIETFDLSQIAANDNYVKQTYYDDVLDRLKDRPIFRDNASTVGITVKNEDGHDAKGNDDETVYESYTDSSKPYMQRGKQITVTVRAAYPLTITLWGKKYERDIPVSFTLKPVGLKHYKDLPLDF